METYLSHFPSYACIFFCQCSFSFLSLAIEPYFACLLQFPHSAPLRKTAPSSGEAPLHTLSPVLRLSSFGQNILCCENRVFSSIIVSIHYIPVSCLLARLTVKVSGHQQDFNLCVHRPLGTREPSAFRVS